MCSRAFDRGQNSSPTHVVGETCGYCAAPAKASAALPATRDLDVDVVAVALRMLGLGAAALVACVVLECAAKACCGPAARAVLWQVLSLFAFVAALALSVVGVALAVAAARGSGGALLLGDVKFEELTASLDDASQTLRFESLSHVTFRLRDVGFGLGVETDGARLTVSFAHDDYVRPIGTIDVPPVALAPGEERTFYAVWKSTTGLGRRRFDFHTGSTAGPCSSSTTKAFGELG